MSSIAFPVKHGMRIRGVAERYDDFQRVVALKILNPHLYIFRRLRVLKIIDTIRFCSFYTATSLKGLGLSSSGEGIVSVVFLSRAGEAFDGVK